MNYELISDPDIDRITKKLKDLVPGWAQSISEKISKDAHWKIYSNKKCSEQIVTNIGRLAVASQLHRRLFVKYASEILTPIIQQQNILAKTAKKIA